MIKFEVLGDTVVQASFDTLAAREHAALVTVTNTLGLELLAQVVDVNLAGAVLKRQTGTLARAQNVKTLDTATEISASVGFNKGTAPYGVYHEYGVPHEWVITAVRAKALRFKLGAGAGISFAVGSMAEYASGYAFRKSVVHPPLPERSFLRSALAWLAPQVQPAYEAALAEVHL